MRRNPSGREYRFSIRLHFTFIFISLMAGILFLCWAGNTFFLEQFYMEEKKNTLFSAYKSIEQASKTDNYGTPAFTADLEEVCRVHNIIICVIDVDSQIKYVSKNGGGQMEERLLGYIFGLENTSVSVLEQGEDYRLQISGKGKGEYLEMYGRLETGASFMMQTPLDSIRESADLANEFLTYIGILGVVLGAFIIWFVTYSITKPILRLSDISDKMVHLNFDAKFEKKGPFKQVKSEIDQLGENINRMSESLEKSVSELKTANNELKRDIEKRDQADRMRTDFLASVSHELKTPIALIQGYAEGLQEGIGEDAESRKYYCDVIVDEAAKMNRMVNRLLTLNELEFGNVTVNMERFDLALLLKNYVQSAGLMARQQGITIDMPDYEPVFVWADEYGTEEVVANYFSNAIHYCAGAKKIQIRLLREKNIIKTEVFNTGEKIPEEALDHLWDKFYKVDKARTREYDGSGVGLSIVKAIQESVHQRYGVENREDGVCFWFTLEAVSDDLEAEIGEGPL